ncbi:S-layer homology domain-containing protein [Anabaena cylindrica UHCC 0172]|uniref:S-layer homology domain-containing protein n=1 Tax=Anabaena cylindrica TaxID=1165 RepID=UPI002B203E91|nr:S-layer homology domain-containing protein [Anabaena cylindrica]MEA5552959.1 S-layer homology domain-containing protein [Anabaena cylindrica UHCC 0172]
MLPSKPPVLFLGLAVLLSSLTACANGPAAKNLEQSLAADPRLQSNPAVFGETKSKEVATASTLQLPADFSKDIPIYPNAKLEEVKPASSSENKLENKISTRWQSSDPSNLIASFYSSQFQGSNWQILQQPKNDVEGTFEVKRNNLLLQVTIQPKSVTNAAPNQPQTATELLIEYVTNNTTTQPNTNSSEVPQSSNPTFIGPVYPTTVPPTTNVVKQPTSQFNSSESQEFTDLNKVPPEWRQHIQDLATLGVLSIEPKTTKSNSTTQTKLFEPNKIITRREYARWLVAANNAMYGNNPAKKVRLASESNQPAFRDVLAKDPDFPTIQGLAEAGLIPSSLSGDTTAVLFRPDAPLTREQLLLWKVPLDTRQALPAANLEAVKQTWGFQDTEKIEPKALKAVLADFQNAEQSNIRRVFGYTTLFQPKKAVTRAEAGAALWYFGIQSEGMTATEALKLKN